MIRTFVRNYGTIAYVVLAVAGMSLLQLIFLIASPQGLDNLLVQKLSMPGDAGAFLHQPWGWLTYWTLVPLRFFLLLLVNLMIFFTMGLIIRQLMGDLQFRAVLVIGTLITPLIILGLVAIGPESWGRQYIFGMHYMNAALMGAVIRLAPTYKVRVFFTNNVPIFWVAGLILIVQFFMYFGPNTLMGLGVPVAASLGFGGIVARQKGFNIGRWFGLPFLGDRAVVPPTLSWARNAGGSTYSGPARVKEEKPQLSEEEELDLLLDKIGKKGIGNLSRKERKRLDELSGGMKKK